MTQLDDLQAFTNLELPRRRAMLTVTITGFDGDPNSGGAPAILQGAPVGTWYLRETPVQMYEKLTAGAATWTEAGAGGGGFRTEGPMVIPVDFNDGGAVDPPPSAVLQSQVDVDAALGGASNFKHFNRVVEKIAGEVAHGIEINLAAGIHHVDAAEPGFAAFAVGAFDSPFTFLAGGSMNINGSSSSTYTQVVAPLTVLSFDDGAVSSDPSITFTGTPFLGLFLKGLIAVASNGFVGVISDHTDDTLFVNIQILPSLVPATDTVFVGRPSTELRNSKLATPTTAFGSVCLSTSLDALGFGPSFEFGPTFNDLHLNHLFATWVANMGSFALGKSAATFNNCVADYELQDGLLGGSGNGRTLQVSGGTVTWNNSSHRSRNVAGQQAIDEPMIMVQATDSIALLGSYVGEIAEDPIIMQGSLFLQRTVIEGIGGADQCIFMLGSEIRTDDSGDPGSFFKGRHSTIRGAPAAGGILMDRGATWGRSTFFFLKFQDCIGPCFVIRDGSSVIADARDTQTGPHGFIDGGGNLDVAFEMDGVRSQLALDAFTTVTGAVNDLRIEGLPGPYGDIDPPTAPTVTVNLNVVSRKP